MTFFLKYINNIKKNNKMLKVSNISTITTPAPSALRRTVGTGTGTAVPTTGCGIVGMT